MTGSLEARAGRARLRRRASCVVLGPALGLTLGPAACMTLEPFLFTYVEVERYDWDASEPCDPQLAGELEEVAVERGWQAGPAGCHPSRVAPEQRVEGFVELDDRRVHYVLAHRPDAIATLVYAHGRSTHIGRYWDRVEELHARGYNVLAYDYPKYGRSTGEVLNETTVYENGSSIYRLLPSLPAIDLERVFLYGYSFGGASAMYGGSHWPAELGFRARGVIAESAFCDVQALVEDGAFIDIPAEFVAENSFSTCDSIAAMPMDIPVMLIHGDADSFIRPFHVERIRDAARVAPELHWVEGANHREVPSVGGESYYAWVDSFIARNLLQRSGPNDPAAR